MTRLVVGQTELDILPDLGGAIGSLLHQGQPVLRPTPDGAVDVLQTAMYPLVPFANRIRHGIVHAEKLRVQLTANHISSDHPLHGHGWQRRWQLTRASKTSAHLSYRYDAADWPWDYEAGLTYQLRSAGLRTSLSLTNLSNSPMPAGLGFHPFFKSASNCRLQASVDGVWLPDKDTLPHRWQAPPMKDWNSAALVGGNPRTIDHCHTGFRGRANIFDDDRLSLSLRASENCKWLHIFIPHESDFFCVEPVTHMPDPFSHLRSGIRLLEPGDTLKAWMELDIHSG